MNRKRKLWFGKKTEKSPKTEIEQIKGNIHGNISDNKAALQQIFHQSTDIKYREFNLPLQEQKKVLLCYLEGLINAESINKSIMEPILEESSHSESPKAEVIPFIQNRIVHNLDVKEVTNLKDMVKGILVGKTVIMVEGSTVALVVNTIRYESRGIEEPDTESTVRGPREGFNEVLKTNTSMLRRIIKNPNLRFEDMQIGELTQTTVRIGYVDGIAKDDIVKEVKKRLKAIQSDSILESGYIEQFIRDHKFSPFPTVGNSEKPDKVAAKLLEGRVAILCDGTPFVLTVPFLFIEALQVPEDYYNNYLFTTFIRFIRIISLFLTIYTAPLFVAASTFHQEMVPTLLLTTMAAAEEKVPFPIMLEAILMLIVFQLLREAGVRMPRPVGSAISIVGALVIGEATVQAGLVGAPMVIVVALTAITGFVVTVYNGVSILIRYFLLLLAGTFGLYGLLMGSLIVITHVCSLRSFGIPYLTPYGPIILKEWKDFPFRLPIQFMKNKPKSTTKNTGSKGDVYR